MSGLLARVLAQALMAGVSVVTKAFVQAYQRAQAGGGAQAAQGIKNAVSANRMALDQAQQVLNLEKTGYTREQILAQFQKYYEANDPDKGGSFYIQSKLYQARETLIDDIRRNPSHGTSSTGTSSNASSSQQSERMQ